MNKEISKIFPAIIQKNLKIEVSYIFNAINLFLKIFSMIYLNLILMINMHAAFCLRIVKLLIKTEENFVAFHSKVT